jgi:selenoprotein W-related protein
VVAAVKEALDVDIELIKGRGGVFDVHMDGALVARKASGIFPTEQQVVVAVRDALGSRG